MTDAERVQIAVLRAVDLLRRQQRPTCTTKECIKMVQRQVPTATEAEIRLTIVSLDLEGELVLLDNDELTYPL